MLYDSTKTLLRTIVQSLETSDKPAWDDLIESGQECLYEMHQMTRSLCRANNHADSDKRFRGLHLARLSRSMPHTKAMVAAIRHQDRATALESGNAALAVIDNPGASRLPVSPTESAEVTHVVQQAEEPVGKRRALGGKRKAGQTSAATLS
jgi:hypothetical protein